MGEVTAPPRPSRPRGMPADTPDYMAPAWTACVSWAIGSPEIMARFRAETGNQWEPGRNGIDRAIDDACGAPAKFIAEFIEWVNRELWGTMDAN